MIRTHRLILIVSVIATLLPASCALAQSIDERIDNGMALLREGKLQEGHDLLRAVETELQDTLRKYPNEAPAAFQLGRVYYYTARNERALEQFDNAIRIDSENADYHFFRGIIARDMEDLSQAEASLKRATELDPTNAQFGYERGQVLVDQSRWAEAKPVFEKVLSIAPEHGDALYDLGYVCTKLGEHSDAVNRYRKLLKIDPDNPDVHYNLGQSLQTLHKYEQSLAEFQRVVALSPSDWRARAKVIQNLEALNRPMERDQAHGELIEFWKKNRGSIESETFCRDQFETDKFNVLVLEYFELEGEWKVRYSFRVSSKADNKHLYRISLGSYDATDEFARSRGAVSEGNRYFHLDRYFPDDSHETYLFFDGEPIYDKTKELVIDIIKGRIKPQSAMIPDANDEKNESGQ